MKMIREILTLKLENIPTQYYINFDKERTVFVFQPTLKHKSAPSFTIHVIEGNLITEDKVSEEIIVQAKEKVKEILSNMIFDKF
jgi:hypothetical protein